MHLFKGNDHSSSMAAKSKEPVPYVSQHMDGMQQLNSLQLAEALEVNNYFLDLTSYNISHLFPPTFQGSVAPAEESANLAFARMEVSRRMWSAEAA